MGTGEEGDISYPQVSQEVFTSKINMSEKFFDLLSAPTSISFSWKLAGAFAQKEMSSFSSSL